MKKITAVLLIAVCCVMFSACNSEGSKTETTAPTAQPTSSESTTDKTQAELTELLSNGSITVTLSY